MGAISKVLISRVGSVEFMFRMLGKSMRRRALSLARSIGHYLGRRMCQSFDCLGHVCLLCLPRWMATFRVEPTTQPLQPVHHDDLEGPMLEGLRKGGCTMDAR